MKMPHFGIYSLDPAAARLLKHGEIVPLPPKALAFLGYLLERRGRLVTKVELLDKVWGHRFVSEGVLKNTVALLRQALGDDPKTPHYIETVHKLGYRFIADTATVDSLPPQVAAKADSCHSSLVGRDEPLAELWRILDKSAEGQAQMVFVSGEAGIGKTSLIEAFLQPTTHRVLLGRGQCFDQYGTSEPYMPVLEAINDLMRQESDRFLELMHQVAPTWLAQLPWYLHETDQTAMRQVLAGASQMRMLREFGEFLGRCSAEKPLVLVLEDLHWSDQATLDLLAYLARRRHAERWMIVASYRPEEVLLVGHPLKSVRRELTIQGLCRDVALQPLSETAVKEYLFRRFPGWQIPDAWIKTLRDRSDGVPYCLVRLVEDLQAEQILAGDAEQGWVSAPLPEGMALLLARQFERLPDDCRRVLEAACVSGMSFSAEVLAAELQEDAAEIEACLESLARMRQFIQAGEDASARAYRFRHAFQREFVYGRLLPAQRRRLHAGFGEGRHSVPDTRGNLVLGRLR